MKTNEYTVQYFTKKAGKTGRREGRKEERKEGGTEEERNNTDTELYISLSAKLLCCYLRYEVHTR